MFGKPASALLLALALLPAPGWADSARDKQAAIVAAHREAAAAARGRAVADAAQAAALAQAQVVAAQKLRRLERLTGDAAARLASLQAARQAGAAEILKDESALASLLPVMQRLATQPAATILATGRPPVDALRGILVLQGVAAEIQRRAAAVQAAAQAAQALLRQMSDVQLMLAAAVTNQRAAEAALDDQIAAARATETADIGAAASEAAAAAAADSRLHDMDQMLRRLRPAAPAGTAAQKLGMAPVAGDIVENFGDPTLAGPATGQTYRAAPGARVVAPCAGPVLFANRFQSYGLLVILDCGGNYDFVLSGMQRLDVAAGQKMARGQPVGEMPAFDSRNPAAEPDLYVELRKNGAAVDPSQWLSGGGSG
jgi:murein DD-endopeptidase MepM/ murein hydrolase activator NlpD